MTPLGSISLARRKAFDDLLDPLFRREPPDIEEGEPAPHAERRPQLLAPSARMEQLRVHSPAPDLHVHFESPSDSSVLRDSLDGVYTRRLRR